MKAQFQRINIHWIFILFLSAIAIVIFYLFLFFTDVTPVEALPETASSTFPYANGTVNKIIHAPDGLFYLGGSFTYLGSYTGCAVPVNKTTVRALLGIPQFASSCTVYTSIPDGSNGWYVGGSFSNVGGNTTYNGVVHILSTGALDTSFVSPDLGSPTVYALAYDQTHNVLFIGGSWFGAEGDRLGLAAVNASTGTFLEWYANISDFTSVRTLSLSGNTLYVGGGFTSVAGNARNGLAAIDITNILTDTTGILTSWDPSVTGGEVYTIQVDADEGSVYIGGSFTSVGLDARNYLAEINSTTGAATAWNPDSSSFVDVLKIDSASTIFVGGRFSTIGSATRRGLALIDRDTGTATSWDANLNDSVASLEIDGSHVFIGGNFTQVNSVSRMYFAVLDKDTAALDTSITSVASNNVSTLTVSGSNLYIGGSFASFGGAGRNRLAAIDPRSGSITSWDPSVDSTVYALAADASNIYVGGSFSTVDGTTRNKIAAIALDGTLQSWDPNISGGDVKEIAVTADSVYAGGTFSTVGTDAHSTIAKIDKTTGVASAWDPNLSGGWSGVLAIVPDSTTIYIGGGFTTVGGDTRNHLAAIDASTGVATSWDPNVDGDVASIAIGTSTLFIGGSFSNVGSDSRYRVAEIGVASGVATPWDVTLGMTNNLKGITLTSTTLFVAGDFGSVNSDSSYSKIVALSRYTGSIMSGWRPQFDMGMTQIPYTIAYYDGMLAIGGSFNSVDGNSGNGKFAFYGPITVGFVSSTTGSGTTVYSTSETVTGGVLTVGILNGVTSTQEVSIDYTVTGGTATAGGIDYSLASGTAIIPAGSTSTPITLSVVNDNTVESDETVVVTLSSPQDAGLSSDYSSATYTIVNDDVAPPGVTVSETLGSTDVTEGGGTDSYSIVLDSAPTSDVTVSLSSSGGNQLSLSPSSIVFTTSNWNVPVTVTVSAVDDDIAEGSHTSTLTQTATSADGNYNGISISSLRVSIIDNGDTAGVTKTESSGSTAVSEAGLSDSYTLVLTSQPTSTVTIAVGTTSADISLSTSSIAFTSSNWDQAVTVTVSAVNDTTVEDTETALITHTVTSDNWNYSGLSVGSVTVTLTDNDVAGQTSSESLGSSRSGAAVPPVLPAVLLPNLPPQIEELPLTETKPVTFQVGRDSHSIELLSFSDRNISFVLHSDPIRLTIVKDTPLQVDTDNNGTMDVQVEYIGVENNIPKIRVTSLLDANESQKAVTINNGAYKTASSQVKLSFNVKEASEIAISNSPLFESAFFVPYQSSMSWKLSGGAGEKTVYVRFVSTSGGMIDASDTIQYDPFNQYDPIKEAEKKEIEKSQKPAYSCPVVEGKAYKTANSPVIYYVVGKDDEEKVADLPVCTKRPFKDADLFFTYFNSYSDAQIIDESVLSSIPNDPVSFIPLGPKATVQSGAIVKKITNSKVYLILGSSFNWLETEKIFHAFGFTFNMVQDVSQALFSQFSEGLKIDTETALPAGAIFQYRGDVDIYRLDMDNSVVPPQLRKRKIVNPETLKKLYRTDRVIQINPTQVYLDGPEIR